MRVIGLRTSPGRRDDRHVAHAGAPVAVPGPDTFRIDWAAARTADRSCCCTARPAVVAIIPPSSGREHPTDLLMCMHHYRLHRRRLERAGATTADLSGRLIRPGSSAYLPVPGASG